MSVCKIKFREMKLLVEVFRVNLTVSYALSKVWPKQNRKPEIERGEGRGRRGTQTGGVRAAVALDVAIRPLPPKHTIAGVIGHPLTGQFPSPWAFETATNAISSNNRMLLSSGDNKDVSLR